MEMHNRLCFSEETWKQLLFIPQVDLTSTMKQLNIKKNPANLQILVQLVLNQLENSIWEMSHKKKAKLKPTNLLTKDGKTWVIFK